MKTRLLLVLLALLFVAPATTKAGTIVDLELALLVDVSGSVDANEFALQKGGYVNAFNDATIQALITSTANGHVGKIAATLVYWSGNAQQSTAVGWTLIDSAASASAFATAVNNAARPFNGSTAPGSAINFVTPGFGTNLFDGTRQVIDVSGDGAQNDGANTATARNAALAAGVDAINGLPILGEAGLLAWYTNNIQGGTNSFTLPASGFADFESAIKTKLAAEIKDEQPTPEPTSYALMAAGLGLLGLLRKRVS